MLRRTALRAWNVEPAWLISLGLALNMFSGNWSRISVPVALDRLLLAAGFGLVILRAGSRPDLPPIRWRLLHLLLLAVLCYGIASAFWVGNLDEHDARIGLLDRLGFVPFVGFALMPTAFATSRQRDILLRVLVVLGLYLGFTAVVEGIKLNSLVWPRYILDDTIGITSGRSRGPFIESAANGLAMIACAAAAGIALARWRRPSARALAWTVMGLCAAGATLTYTRQVWIGAVAGGALALIVFPRLRWRLLPTGAVIAGVLIVMVALVPGFGADLSERFNATKPVETRRTLNQAALLMIEEKPLWGWGWEKFPENAPAHFRTIVDIRYQGQGQQVHNLFLARATELGLVGGGLWLIAVLLALGGPLLRRHDDDRELWRIGYCVVLVASLSSALVAPFNPVFPILMLWLWAGLLVEPAPYVPRRAVVAARASPAPA